MGGKRHIYIIYKSVNVASRNGLAPSQHQNISGNNGDGHWEFLFSSLSTFLLHYSGGAELGVHHSWHVYPKCNRWYLARILLHLSCKKISFFIHRWSLRKNICHVLTFVVLNLNYFGRVTILPADALSALATRTLPDKWWLAQQNGTSLSDVMCIYKYPK